MSLKHKKNYTDKPLLIAILVLVAGGLIFLSGCKPKYPLCKKDSHCKEGEFCINGKCQKCRTSEDCEDNEKCVGGLCSINENHCKSDSDCEDGMVCRDNECSPCLSSDDCPGDNECISGKCDVPECHKDEDCPAGLSCVDFKCKINVSTTSALGEGDCELSSILFDFDSSEMSDQARQSLKDNFQCWQDRGGRLTLEGHCDPRGTTEYNMALGDRRGRIVKKLMVTMGAESKNIQVISKGEEEATGSSESGWAEDRRVDFE